MAHQVTKRIKGHDYRYVVDSYRDPETNRRKERWQYVGVVDNGEVRTRTSKPRKRVSREEFVVATARLLEFRAPEYLTGAVIAAGAGASRTAFYRHFSSPKEAITEALTRMTNAALQALPPLRRPRNLEDAREQLRLWCKALNHSAGLNRTCGRALRQGYLPKLRHRLEMATDSEKPPAARLYTFFKELNDAGLAVIEDPEGLADAVSALHIALRFSDFALPSGAASPLPDYDRVYPLVERAVFGELRSAEKPR